MTCHHRSAKTVEQLFRDHHADIVATLQRRFEVSPEIAEDACSRAWEQLLRLQPRGDRLDAWLYTVAKNEAITILQRRRRETPVAEPQTDDNSDLMAVLEARDILRVMTALKPQQQVVLRLRAEGHSYTDIAEITGRTYTWVNRHLREGRAALREELAVG